MPQTNSQSFLKLVNFCKDYWKLEAKDVDHQTLAGVNRDLRMQRGLIDYYNCTDGEPRRFYQQRKLTTRHGDSDAIETDQLIARLQHAGDHATSDKFLDLPAELRVNIYEHYTKSLPTTEKIDCIGLRYTYGGTKAADFSARGRPTIRTQPPVTKVSRLVRKESLAVWYECGDFGLMLYDLPELHRSDVPAERRMVYSMKTTQEAWRFFAHCPPSVIGSITALTIDVEGPIYDRDTATRRFWRDKSRIRFRIADLHRKVEIGCGMDETQALADIMASHAFFQSLSRVPFIADLDEEEVASMIKARREYVQLRAEFLRKAMAKRSDKLKFQSSDLADLVTLFNEHLELAWVRCQYKRALWACKHRIAGPEA